MESDKSDAAPSLLRSIMDGTMATIKASPAFSECHLSKVRSLLHKEAISASSVVEALKAEEVEQANENP